LTRHTYIIQQECVPYYDRVALGLSWEARVVVVKDDAGADSGTISVSGI
jgi:hypothetical protein